MLSALNPLVNVVRTPFCALFDKQVLEEDVITPNITPNDTNAAVQVVETN